MKNFNRNTLACCIFLCAVFSAPAQAAVLFQGNAVGSFSNITSAANDYVLINNHDKGTNHHHSATFKWGTVLAKMACVGDGDCKVVPKPKSGSSSFSFDGVGSDAREKGYKTTLGSVFSLGRFQYDNRSVHFANGVTGVDFTVDVGFKNLGTTSPFTYHLAINNTPDSPHNVADTIGFTDLSSPYLFSFGGNTYQFSLLGFSTDNGASFVNSLTVDENDKARGQLFGRFTLADSQAGAPVPLPATLGLFSAGLLGLVRLGSRKRV